MTTSSANLLNNRIYVLITNIPSNFHSKDLRNYFYSYIEKGAFFKFHFRHRPEASMMVYLKSIKKLLETNLQASNSVLTDFPEKKSCSSELFKGIEKLSEVIASSEIDGKNLQDAYESNQHLQKEFAKQYRNDDSHLRCCALLLIKEEFLNCFKARYNKKFWVSIDGIILPIRCFIFDLTLILKLEDIHAETGADDISCATKSSIQEQRRNLAFKKINQLMEFDTPYFMPQGNVGTPNPYFKSLLNQCKLPTSIISKLGLDFNKRHPKKKYSQVHLNYGTGTEFDGLHSETNEAIFTENGDLIPGYFDIKFNKCLLKPQKSSGPIFELTKEDEDGAETEEWDRFEAFHDDVTKQERVKERIFESEIEQVWEKGGPGLVFYTDAQFWRIYEGGEEERNTDEWDVDISPYYEGGGDLDARASLSMIEMDRLKSGTLTASVFSHPRDGSQRTRTQKNHRFCPENQSLPHWKGKQLLKKTRMQREDRKKRGSSNGIGVFEKHTKGIGRRVLESQGWKDGEGLGREKKGMACALDSAGKHPLDKTGFGYSEKMTQPTVNERLVSTAFDCPAKLDPSPSLYRSTQSSSLSHRISPSCIRTFRKAK